MTRTHRPCARDGDVDGEVDGDVDGDGDEWATTDEVDSSGKIGLNSTKKKGEHISLCVYAWLCLLIPFCCELFIELSDWLREHTCRCALEHLFQVDIFCGINMVMTLLAVF